MKKILLTRVYIIVCMILSILLIWQSYTLDAIKKDNFSQMQTISDLKVKLKDAEQKVADLKSQEEIHPIEQKVQQCMKNKNYTTAGMSQCVNDSITDWNNEIDKYMSLLKKKLTKEQCALVASSQAEWEKYKKAEWLFLNSSIGQKEGTMYINILSASKADIVEKRARDLESLYYILFPDEKE